MQSAQGAQKQTPDRVEKFRLLCERLALVLQKEGLSVKPYHDPALPFFNQLNENQKDIALQTLKDYLEICQEAHAESFSLKDSPRFCWKALRRWGLIPASDFFDKLQESDSVEVYTDEGLQVFRNLRFFEVCTYTLEELYSLEWWKLYGREESVTRNLFSILWWSQGIRALSVATERFVASYLRRRWTVSDPSCSSADLFMSGAVASMVSSLRLTITAELPRTSS